MIKDVFPLSKQLFYNNFPLKPSTVKLLDEIFKPCKHRKKFISGSRQVEYPCVFCYTNNLGFAEHNSDCPVRDNIYLIIDENLLLDRFYKALPELEKGWKEYQTKYYCRWMNWARQTLKRSKR